MLRYFNVFHINQCDGLEAKQPTTVRVTQEKRSGEELISQYQNRERIQIRYLRGDEASYSPTHDRITLPLREQFLSAAEFYSTALHEVVHSTGHQKRLNRLRATAHFGNEEYSREELVAEIGSAALMNLSGIETRSSLKNSSAYIQSWLKALNNDRRMIVQASGQASKAVEYILGVE